MNLSNYLPIDEGTTAHFEEVYARYRLLHDDPERCRPMIIINTPVQLPVWEERLADPLVMLQAELDLLRPHLDIRDDRVPTVRVQFGTAQVAAAFGCQMVIPGNNLPAAGSHVLTAAGAVHGLKLPALDAGWYGKLMEWTELWKKHLPTGVHIQLPDIQSAFNSAHLIRGNDILTDFYDCPEDVDLLLDKVTDFMLAITQRLKSTIGDDPEWFFDWGAMWKGAARISNCSMQMISPALYREHILPRDVRFFDTLGGGRMHYCGMTADVIDDFMKVPAITGLDVDCTHHDFFALCERAPARLVLMPTGEFGGNSPELMRLLQGDWPCKRNIVIMAGASSVADGRRLLEQLRASIPY
ncbi:MAG: uroporphyrinogen decarboxylase family protein [bacterium]